jgi:hypothetical protein
MKPFLALLLCASIAANIFLFKNRSNPTVTTVQSSDTKKTAPAVPTISAETWALIQSGDPSGPEKLKALGLSDSVINALVRYQTDLRYREREKALTARFNDAPYWTTKFDLARYQSYRSPELIDLRREKEAELKTLLGADYRKYDPIQDPRTAFLPPAKAEQLRMIEEDYEALRLSSSPMDGITMPEDREKLAFLEKQKRADLAELLTPEELAAYDLRNSPTARSLRSQLAFLNLTEDEFKTLFTLRKPYDERPRAGSSEIIGGSSVSISSPASAKDREALNAEIKAALGDERFAEYQRAQDSDYRTLNQLVGRLELPPEKANEAYSLKIALEKKLMEFRPQPGSDMRQQRANFIASLSREAETGFTQILGEKGYATYKDYGQIFRRLQPPPARPAAP